MLTTDVSLRPDYREFLAENTGFLLLFAFSLMTMPIVSAMKSTCLPIVTGLLSLLIAAVLIVRYISLTAVTWIVNKETICRIHGVVSCHTDYVELYRVIDYRESQTLLQKILNVKTVTVISTDRTDGIMEMYGIRSSFELVKIIRQRVEKCKQEKRIYEITNN